MSKIFDISPCSKYFSTFYLVLNDNIIWVVCVVKFPVIPQEETCKIKCQVTLLQVWAEDCVSDVHLSQNDIVRFEASIHLGIILQVFKQDLQCYLAHYCLLVVSHHANNDCKELIDDHWLATWWQCIPFVELTEFKELVLQLQTNLFCFHVLWELNDGLNHLLVSRRISRIGTGFFPGVCLVRRHIMYSILKV